jgi:hypothetical protein
MCGKPDPDGIGDELPFHASAFYIDFWLADAIQD